LSSPKPVYTGFVDMRLICVSLARYYKVFNQKLQEREEAKLKRQMKLLAVTTLLDEVKQKQKEKAIKTYRHTAESAVQDEQTRMKNHEEEKKANKEKLMKQLEYVKIERTLPPIKSLKPLIPKGDVIKTDDNVIAEKSDVIAIENSTSSSEEEEEDICNITCVEIKTNTISKLPSLTEIKGIQHDETSSQLNPAKRRALLKDKSKFNLPPLKHMKNKLKLALDRGSKKTLKEDSPSYLQQKQQQQKQRKISRKTKRRRTKKTKKDKDEIEIIDKIEELEIVNIADSNHAQVEPKEKVPVLEEQQQMQEEQIEKEEIKDYLEVDLGKDHFVQQIVLEVMPV